MTTTIAAAVVAMVATACACERQLEPVGQMVIVSTPTTAASTAETLPPSTLPPETRRAPQTTSSTALGPPSITSFGANPPSGTGCQGEDLATTLSWTTTGATEVTLDGAPVGVQGSSQQSVGCGNTKTFTLVAKNAVGSDSRTVTVQSSD